MKKIIHTCSSALVRPNGIVRYINSSLELQQSLGHETIFVSDSKPAELIKTDNIFYKNLESTYIPNRHPTEDHVWLQIDQNVVSDLEQSLRQAPRADFVFCHDLQSFLAAKRVYKTGIFCQHESDVLYQIRRSYISTEWFQAQTKIVQEESEWQMGMVVYTDFITAKNSVSTPFIFTPEPAYNLPRNRDLLFIGEPSVRKGAPQFLEMAQRLGVRATVISKEYDPMFKNVDHYSFEQTDRQKMFGVMRDHKVAYIPSQNETFGYGILECLQFMPVVLDRQYPYARLSEQWGTRPVENHEIETVLRHLIQFYDRHYQPHKLIEVCLQNKAQWRTLTND